MGNVGYTFTNDNWLPVVRGDRLVGNVARSDLIRVALHDNIDGF